MESKILAFDKLNAKDPKEKYAFVRELLKVGSEKPELLYWNFNCWAKMLTNENNILKWAAIDIMGYVSAVDTKNKIETKIDDLLGFLHCGHLITCNHAIDALGLIAQNKPEHRDRILRELIAVSNDTYNTETCKDIAIGKVLEILGKFPDDIKDDEDALRFIRLGQTSKRNATKKKADKLLGNLEKSKK